MIVNPRIKRAWPNFGEKVCKTSTDILNLSLKNMKSQKMLADVSSCHWWRIIVQRSYRLKINNVKRDVERFDSNVS